MTLAEWYGYAASFWSECYVSPLLFLLQSKCEFIVHILHSSLGWLDGGSGKPRIWVSETANGMWMVCALKFENQGILYKPSGVHTGAWETDMTTVGGSESETSNLWCFIYIYIWISKHLHMEFQHWRRLYQFLPRSIDKKFPISCFINEDK